MCLDLGAWLGRIRDGGQSFAAWGEEDGSTAGSFPLRMRSVERKLCLWELPHHQPLIGPDAPSFSRDDVDLCWLVGLTYTGEAL